MSGILVYFNCYHSDFEAQITSPGLYKNPASLSVVVQTHNPTVWEVEANLGYIARPYFQINKWIN